MLGHRELISSTRRKEDKQRVDVDDVATFRMEREDVNFPAPTKVHGRDDG